MGKALLILVLGSGLILTRQLLNTTENERKTNENQVAYQEEVVAREIATSAFNVAMGEIRSYGEDLHTGVEMFNGAGGGRAGNYSSGRFAGGSYTSEALLTSGHSVRVVSTGTFGEAEFTLHDEYRIPVLIAREDGIVLIEPNDMDPDVCAAIFYQAYPIGADPAALPEPELIFASWNGDRDQNDHLLQPIYATAGTQMNFFLAIDEDCSERIDVDANECFARSEARTHTFDASTWDAIHYALDVDPGDVNQAKEGVWAFVEQDARPSMDRQSWRISWEDQHLWNAPSEGDPTQSLQALKGLGYDAAGWSLASGTAYVQLADQGNDRPDYADQSITVTVYDVNNPNYKGVQTSILAKQKHCGEEYDDPIDGEEYDVDEDGETDVGADETAPEPVPEPGTVDSDEDGFTEEELTDYACGCTSNGTKSNKTAILHRPPGNEANEQLICIGTPAVPSHFENHNDVFPTCEAGRNIRNNNRNR